MEEQKIPLEKIIKLQKRTQVLESMTFELNDKLCRQKVAETFNLLFKDTSQPFVISLDSPWGTGKTQFIYMWKNLLEEKRRSPIYINLWEEDFLRNPFFSLTETLSKKFEEQKIGESVAIKDWKRIGYELSRGVVHKVFGADINNIIDENYNSEQKKKKDSFKENLKNFADKVKKETNFPLLIFIDELDRCRPDYAVEFLEIVKHFFNVENIIFVLGIDMEQLQHSVKSLYGEGMNAKEYLRKFIDFSYSFPDPTLDNYLDILFSEFKCGNKEDILIKISKEIIGKFNPSLRKIDNLFIRLKLIEEEISDSYIQATFLLSLKIFEEDKYFKIINTPCSLDDVLDLKWYFNNKYPDYREIIFWKLANDIILRNSQNEGEYKINLKALFSKLRENFPHLLIVLPKFTALNDSHFSITYLSEAFVKDENLEKEETDKLLKNIFNSKPYHLEEFLSLRDKIDFLEELTFREDIEESSKSS